MRRARRKITICRPITEIFPVSAQFDWVDVMDKSQSKKVKNLIELNLNFSLFHLVSTTLGGPIEFPFGFWVFPGDYRSGRFFFKSCAVRISFHTARLILRFWSEFRILVGGLDINLAQQLRLYLARASGHEVCSFIVFREGYNFSDAILTCN